MTNENFFIGEPIRFKNLCKIYPAKVREVITNEELGLYQQLLFITQDELRDKWFEEKIEGEPFTPFQFVLNYARAGEGREEMVSRAFQFFIHEPVSFLFDMNTIVIGDLKEELKKIDSVDELRLLKEEDYFDFQNLLRESFGDSPVGPPDPPDLDPRIARIKRLGRKREKLAAKKGLKFSDLMVSVCCMGIGITPLNIGELSKCAISALLQSYQAKEKFDLDARSLLAGADKNKVKIEYWIKNFE